MDGCFVDQYGNSACDKLKNTLSDRLFVDVNEANVVKATGGTKDLIKTYGKDRIYLQGIFIVSDSTNRNLNYYPDDIVSPEIDKYQSEIIRGTALGEILHPEDRDIVDPAKVAVKVLSFGRLSENSNEYGGSLLLLNTPRGKILQDLVKDRVTLGVSTRSLGYANKGRINNIMVDILQVWDLLAVDVVFDTGVALAMMQAIRENRYVNKDMLLSRYNENIKRKMDKMVIDNKYIKVSRQDLMNMANDIVGLVKNTYNIK